MSRELLKCYAEGILALIGFGAVIILTACVSCDGTAGCPPFPFHYEPNHAR